MTGLRDQFGRGIEYLRISVTDRCNFRCVYCMPAAGLPWLPKADILSYEEIAEVVRQLAPLGLRRVRLTGGEPTIRPNLDHLVAMLRAVPEVEDIALSTNGVRLPELAEPLRAAGLDRVNVSADSLRPDRVAKIARRDLGFDLARAAGAAERAGIAPIKVNVVVIRGVNDDEIEDFARLTLAHPWHVRFIELMPVGDLANELGMLSLDHVVPADEILERLAADRAARPGCGAATRQRAGAVSPLCRCAGHGRGDHPDVAHLLRILQPRTPDGRRSAAHLPVRRPRSGPARSTAFRRTARAARAPCTRREAARALAAAAARGRVEGAVAGRRLKVGIGR
jgi:GTP 3',8-cyclase